MDLSALHLQGLLERLPSVPLEEKREILQLLDRARKSSQVSAARRRFIDYVVFVWSDFIVGEHHKIVAEAFDRILAGKLKRLIINMPPRHTKSEFGSWLLPSRYFGEFPNRKIIQCSNTADLASGFGRRVRNLINELPEFRQLYPGVELAKDSTAAAHWHTNLGGEYFAIGINGKVTGRGADLLIIDDPHSEQEAKQAESQPEIFDSVYDWYTSGPRQRLQPSGAVVLIVTRWSKRDLAGRLLTDMMNGKGDKFEVITLPAILDENRHNPHAERAMWPGFWNIEELQATRNALPVSKWQAQYQQNPVSEEGAILKREHWRVWSTRTPPPCDYILQSWDTAFTQNTRSSYSACTTWGIFRHRDKDDPNPKNHIILLDAYRDRMGFPELKRKVLEFYEHWEPDNLLIESKGSGVSLVQELRYMGVPVTTDTPTRRRGVNQDSGDKVARANAIADIFESGLVWAPEARWTEEVIEECAEFPFGDNTDYVDTVTQALKRFRAGGFIRVILDDDEDEDETPFMPAEAYY